MKKITYLVACLVALAVVFALFGTPPANAAKPQKDGPIVYCMGDTITGYHPNWQIVVSEYASCTIDRATVKSVRAVNSPQDVTVVDSTVERGIHVMGASGTVHIGARDCKFDPPVGNNVKVTKSHNVLICYVTANNNIQVTDNDGKISLFNNVAGNNIQVSRNAAWVNTDGEPKRAGAIRLRDNEAGNHIQVFNNDDSRRIIAKRNSPRVIIK